MKATTPNRSYYPALDGLRGLAIILVLCCHNFTFIPYMSFGWVGVDLFFVLSGFLITDILLTTKHSKHFLQNFYVRRALRIFPLYYAVILLFFIVAPLIEPLSDQLQYYGENKAMSFFHFQNWLYILNEKPNNIMLFGHFWSLSVEEQYYLVWPIIILCIRSNRTLAHVAIFILIACITFRLTSYLYNGTGYANFHLQYMTRMDGLCVGSLLAIWKHMDESLSWKKFYRFCFGLIGFHALTWFIIEAVLNVNFPHFSILGYSTIAALFGLMVGASLNYKNRLIRIFEFRGLKVLGRISYGLYIFHWPVLVFLRIYFLDLILSTGISRFEALIIVSLMAITVSLGISVLSYCFVESRFLSLKDRFTSEEWILRARQRIILLLRPAWVR